MGYSDRKIAMDISFSDSLFDLCGSTEGTFTRKPIERAPSRSGGRRHFNVKSVVIDVTCLECGKRFKSRDPQDCPRCGGSDLDVA